MELIFMQNRAVEFCVSISTILKSLSSLQYTENNTYFKNKLRCSHALQESD